MTTSFHKAAGTINEYQPLAYKAYTAKQKKLIRKAFEAGRAYERTLQTVDGETRNRTLRNFEYYGA